LKGPLFLYQKPPLQERETEREREREREREIHTVRTAQIWAQLLVAQPTV
jgi:hypothetical protein